MLLPAPALARRTAGPVELALSAKFVAAGFAGLGARDLPADETSRVARARGRARAVDLDGAVASATPGAGRVLYDGRSLTMGVPARDLAGDASIPDSAVAGRWLVLVPVVVLSWAGARVRLRAVAFAAALVGCVLGFAPPIDDHARQRPETESVVATIRAEIVKAPPGEDVYIENRRFLGVGPLPATGGFRWFPGWTAVFAIFFPDDTVDGHPVHFVTDSAIVRPGHDGRRSASLLVPPP